ARIGGAVVRIGGLCAKLRIRPLHPLLVVALLIDRKKLEQKRADGCAVGRYYYASLCHRSIFPDAADATSIRMECGVTRSDSSGSSATGTATTAGATVFSRLAACAP